MESKAKIIQRLDLGGIVAEQDRLLTQCFISSPVITEILLDRKDVVLGAKGAGKSALWKEFKDRQSDYPEISDVYIKLVTNPSGDPEFRDVLLAISAEDFPDEEELRVGWRLYFLSQFWRAAKDVLPSKDSDVMELDKRLISLGLVYKEARALKTAFAYALAKARTLKQLKVEWTKGLSLDFAEESLKAGGKCSCYSI